MRKLNAHRSSCWMEGERPWPCWLGTKLPEVTLGTFSEQYYLLSTLGFLGSAYCRESIKKKGDTKDLLGFQ